MRTIAAMICLTLAGCVTGPTQQEATAAYFGAPIAQDVAEAKVKETMASILKDPASATYQCQLGGQGGLGSGMAWGGVNVYGWILVCDINAKNSYGGYVGAQRYAFIFTDGRLRRGSLLLGSDVTQVVYNSP